MVRTSSVARVMRNRRSPISVPQIASRAGTSEATARNYVTEQSRLDRWLKPDEKMCIFHKGGTASYCVREIKEISPNMKVGNATWSCTKEDAYKAHYTS